jgi:hypothetical protein
MRILTILLIALIAFTANAQITGVWQNNQFGYQIILMLNADGTGELDGELMKYTAKSGVLTITDQRETNTYKYTLNGNSLVVSGGDLDEPMAFTKEGTQSSSPPADPPKADTPARYSDAKNVPQELVGKWCWINVTNTNSGAVSSDRCVTLNGDGTYLYAAERSMSVNDPSFAGGTNSQSSDRGTWWVEGDRMFYNSQSQGQGSYRLEKRNHPKNVNDPMIVLDGQPFVTQFQKAPWR